MRVSLKKLLHHPKLHFWLGTAICVVFGLAYALLALNRYWQFEYFFVDNVYFHTALWKLSRFEVPIVTHQYVGPINIFGDHFHPAIALVALVMMVFPSNATVFVIMAAAYALGGWFAVLVGHKFLQRKWMIHFLLMSYFGYISTQHAFIFGFHEINFVAPFFGLSVWALLNKKWRWYWLGLALLLLTKESMAAIAFGLAFFTWFLGKEYRKVAVATFGVALGWYQLVTKIVIPFFSKGLFLYGDVQFPANIPTVINAMTAPSAKITTMVVSLASFGFLPLLSLPTLPLIAQDFIIRFMFALPGNVQYTLMYHYGVGLAPLLLFSSLWAVKLLEKWRSSHLTVPLAAVLIVLGVAYSNLFLEQRGPLFLLINPEFYQASLKNRFLWSVLNNVPRDGSVMTQNHLGLPLSDREVMPLAKDYEQFLVEKPDYIVYDQRVGQNPNNYFPSTESEWQTMATQATTSGMYRVYWHEGDQFILKRN